ncbi:MAG TPA: lytic transglycosylase domain-containing protein [Candidatus Wallbacteria bacterium]|nr:lytic transglycosylase domain-containing protein [Candidatus Wallbacteria bacterium]
MSVDTLMNRIARIEGRIETIKQRISSLAGGAAFSAYLKNAQNRLQENITGIAGPDSGRTDGKIKNPMAEVSVKMPKITYDEEALKRSAEKAKAGQNLRAGSAAGIEQGIKNTGMSSEIGSIIVENSRKHEIDPLLVSAIMAVESDFNPKVVSDKGAIGLMQLMPETASELGVNPYNLNQNVEGGTRYIKQMLEKFSGDLKLALAAYNAGPNAVIRHGGIPPYAETQNYVLKVLKNYEAYLKQDAGKAEENAIVKAPDGGIKAAEMVNESAAAMTEAVFGAARKNNAGGLFSSGSSGDEEIYADE